VGNGNQPMQQLAPGAEHSLLQTEQGQPVWVSQEQLVSMAGLLRSAAGSYVGNGVTGRTVTLPVAPKVLVIFVSGTKAAPLVLCSGATVRGTYSVKKADNETLSVNYQAYAALDGNTLTFTCDKKGSTMATDPTAELANTTGVTQYWVAVY